VEYASKSASHSGNGAMTPLNSARLGSPASRQLNGRSAAAVAADIPAADLVLPQSTGVARAKALSAWEGPSPEL
jgi:hypothetical protein